MSSGYQKTILLDCNRKNSLEYEANVNTESKAVFTNRVGDGLKLNVGDEVSIHSAYVSSIGAGGEVIEFTGKNTGLKYELSETVINGSGNACNTIEGFEQTFTENVSRTFEVKDNEANVEINFYKNLNGEQYFNLPRRFDKLTSETDTNNYECWTRENISGTGATVERSITYTADGLSSSNGNRYDLLEILCTADYAYNNQLNDNSKFLYKNDNSKALIFVRDGIKYYDPTSASNASQLNTSSVPPWTHKYIPYKQILNFKTAVGFDSPSNIATALTQKLQTKDPAKKIALNIKYPTLIEGFDFQQFNIINDTPLTLINESPTFKTFQSGSPYLCSKTNFEFFTSAYSASLSEQESLDYYNGFQTIGVLRPELFIDGRDLHGEYSNTSGVTTRARGFFETMIPISASLSSTDNEITTLNTSHVGLIVTNLKWNADPNNPDFSGDTMLRRFKKLFESQKLYPELFDFSNNASITTKYSSDHLGSAPSYELNASNARILHGNTALFNLPQNETIIDLNNRTPTNILGDDNMCTYYYEAVFPQPEGYDMRSAPVFIYYDESRKDKFNGDLFEWEHREDSYNNLCYGFAKKYRHTDNEDYIALTTERLGGIPEALNASYGFYNYLDTTNTSHTYRRMLQTGFNGSYSRSFKFGWDFHANAYGNRFINLYNGQLSTFAFENGCNTKIKARIIEDQYSVNANVVPLTYIGAQSPLINFEDADNRFSFSDLYTPEYVQGQFDAGEVVGTKKNASLIPLATSVGKEVYKINKVLSKFTFCPDMIPYIEIVDINEQESQTVNPPNTNLSLYEIFDSHSGITLSNFGINKSQWESSLWKILGFEYNQFNENTNNFQKRIQTTNLPNTNLVTTNAQISVGEIEEYYINPYGGQAFSPILPTSYYIPSNFVAGIDFIPIHPTIDVESVSSKITATNLPIKSTRPYYLIKSDILPDQEYIGVKNGVNLPVCAVVNKVNGYSDAYTLESSQISFTVTKPTVLNTIKTIIADPDGTEATVDDSSGVIYKIVKNIDADLNIANTVLQQNQKRTNRP
jgi:hypothetical protein